MALTTAFIIFALFSASDACSKFQCSSLNFTSNQCIYYNVTADTYNVKACSSSSNQYCPPTKYPTINSTCSVIPTYNATGYAYPGERCTSSSDCVYSYNCTKHVCIGISEGLNCSSNFNCQPGLYCYQSNNTCISQKSIGEPCSNIYECVNSAFCSANKTCKPYYSLEVGELPNDCNQNESQECVTGVCASLNGTTVCVPRAASYLPVPVNAINTCYSDNFKINDTTWNLTGSSTCGYNYNGNAYCNLFPGDSIYNQALNLKQKWFKSSNIEKCNTSRRSASDCQESAWKRDDYLQWQYYSEYVKVYPTLVNSSNCVKEVYNSNWVELEIEVQEEDFCIWLTPSAVIAVLALY